MLSDFIDRAKITYRKHSIKKSLHRNDALGALHRAWAYIYANQITGDYYEFGVYNGVSLFNSWLSYRYFQRLFSHQKGQPFSATELIQRFMDHTPCFYGFDTFAGMPENTEGEDSLRPQTFCGSYDLVVKRCRLAGLQAPNLILRKGLFADHKDGIGLKPAAIIHIDCDLYASAVDALSIIQPKIIQGSVLLCDDYNLFQANNNKGERRAIREFQQKTSITLEPWFAYGPASQAFLCHIEHE